MLCGIGCLLRAGYLMVAIWLLDCWGVVYWLFGVFVALVCFVMWWLGYCVGWLLFNCLGFFRLMLV